jgi:hypothetical protein
MRRVLAAILMGASGPGAWAAVPARQIPPSVLTELQLLENRFELTLGADCAPEICFSKGCTYIAHAVADQPSSASLPGLGQEPGPGSVASQEYLTQARCSFAHEKSVDGTDVQALARRMQAKLSKGWMAVSVDYQALEPIPPALQQSPAPLPEPIAPEPARLPAVEEELTLGRAMEELWTQLLPHFFWMIAVALGTVAATTLLWAWRRVGRVSPEEQALFAQMARGDEAANGAEPTSVEVDGADDEAFVSSQMAAWKEKLGRGSTPAPELKALIRDLLKEGDMPILAKAVLTFPDSFPPAFPSGGEIASAKLELADFLKTADLDALPSDVDFFTSLNRHALSATLSFQSDAQIVRSLREEFGAAGLVELIMHLSARPGALLFALSPADKQHEMSRLLLPRKVAELGEQLLQSNRMDRTETAYLFEVLTAARTDQPIPNPPKAGMTDRGAHFDAAGALSVLLPLVNPTARAALFSAAIDRRHGSVPAWYRGIVYADMLLELPEEARADLLLSVDVDGLAAWLSLLEADTRERVLAGLSGSLRSAVAASSVFPNRTRQLALADRCRQDLASGYQRQLARLGVPLERAVGVRALSSP